jgi:hypothetical protein
LRPDVAIDGIAFEAGMLEREFNRLGAQCAALGVQPDTPGAHAHAAAGTGSSCPILRSSVGLGHALRLSIAIASLR